MPGSDDRGLDLRLPWGRSSPVVPATGRSERPPPIANRLPEPRPEPADATDDGPPDDLGAGTAELLADVELRITAGFAELEQQAEAHAAALEARLARLEAGLGTARTASDESVALLAGWVLAGLEDQVAGVDRALQARHDELVAKRLEAPQDRFDELGAKLDRLESAMASQPTGLLARLEEAVVLLAARHRELLARLADLELLEGMGRGEVVEKVERFELALAPRYDELLARLDRFEALGPPYADVLARLERFESALAPRYDELLAKLEGLAGPGDSRHDELVAKVDGVGAPAGLRHDELLAQLEEVATAMGLRHDELLERLEAAQSATMEAVGGLASGRLIDELLEGVVATGEVLDAELIELRRLVTGGRLVLGEARHEDPPP